MHLFTTSAAVIFVALLSGCEQHPVSTTQPDKANASGATDTSVRTMSATQQPTDQVVAAVEYGPGESRPKFIAVPFTTVGDQRIYKSAEFGYTIPIPAGYRVKTDDRPGTEVNKSRQGFMCLLATDTLKGTNKYATDGRISRNEISIEFEPISDYSSHPTLEKLLTLPAKKLFWVSYSQEPVDVSKRIVTINGVPMLEVAGSFNSRDKTGEDFEAFTTLLWVNGDYLFRATTHSSSRLEAEPDVPPTANQHYVVDGLSSINNIKASPIK